MRLWPFKKSKDFPDVQIQDGRILSVKKAPIPVPEEFPEPLPEASEVVPEKVLPEPEPELRPAASESAIFYPPTEPRYNPSFLVDEPDGGDLGLYLSHLESQGKAYRTRQEYLSDLQIWKRELSGRFPTADLIYEIFSKFKPIRGRRVVTSLRTYAKYRNEFGDPRLIIVFATSPKLSLPLATPERKREIMSKWQLGTYRATARELCETGDRVGIWIGLSLLCVKSSEMRKATLDGNLIRIETRNPRTIEAPDWLVSAMSEADSAVWQRTNNVVRKGIQRYGTSPHLLYMSAVDYKSKHNKCLC